LQSGIELDDAERYHRQVKNPRTMYQQWLTKMFWFGPYLDLTGKPVSWWTFQRFYWWSVLKRIWNLRRRGYFVANFFFTLWVFTDAVDLIQGYVTPTTLHKAGIAFGGLLVLSEWVILWGEYKQSAPPHVLWQMRVLDPPREPYIYFYFESKNLLPFEFRCFIQDEQAHPLMLGSPLGYQECVPTKHQKIFHCRTGTLRSALNGRKSFQAVVEMAPLLAELKVHSRWVFNYALDESTGKFKKGSGHSGGWYGIPHEVIQSWYFKEDQDGEWHRWEEGI
jgi:hypothetical protein